MKRGTVHFLLILLIIWVGLLISSCTPSSDNALPPTPSDSLQFSSSHEEELADFFSNCDSPVVVQYVSSRPYFSQKQIAEIWNAPCVTNVICTSLVHWLDISEKASLCMIGLYLPDLDPSAISEGRWFENESECCLNRAEYERLLADSGAQFHGIGDTVTYTEPITQLGEFFNARTVDPISKQYTVVGIVEKEGIYANEAYGIRHVYAHTDSVASMLVNYRHDVVKFESRLDHEAYEATRFLSSLGPQQFDKSFKSGKLIAYRIDSDNEDSIQIRVPNNRVFSEEEWRSIFQKMPCNAGYTIEVTLNSGKNYAEFADYWRVKSLTGMSMAENEEIRIQGIDLLHEEYEERTNPPDHNGNPVILSAENKNMWDAWLEEHLHRQEQDPLVKELIECDELNQWYVYKTYYCVTLRPLRVEE